MGPSRRTATPLWREACDRRVIGSTLREVQAELETRATQPIHIEHVARAPGLSSWHLIRTSKAVPWIAPYLSVVHLRIARAKKLLRGSESTVAQIARETGLGTSSHFATTSRNHVGVSPSRCRSLARGSAREG